MKVDGIILKGYTGSKVEVLWYGSLERLISEYEKLQSKPGIAAEPVFLAIIIDKKLV